MALAGGGAHLLTLICLHSGCNDKQCGGKHNMPPGIPHTTAHAQHTVPVGALTTMYDAVCM